MRARAILLLLVLAPGCALFRPAPPPEAVAARLWADRVDVTLSNAQTCVGVFAAAAAGPLAGCPAGWTFALGPVADDAEARPLVPGDPAAPRLQVTITDPRGQTRVFAPPSAD